jgi:hypothetical protein
MTGFEPATAWTTIRPPLNGANHRSRTESGFAPASDFCCRAPIRGVFGDCRDVLAEMRIAA